MIKYPTFKRYKTILNGVMNSKKFDYSRMVSDPYRCVDIVPDGYTFPDGSGKSLLVMCGSLPPYCMDMYKQWLPNTVQNSLSNIISGGYGNVLSFEDYNGYGPTYYSNGLIYDRRRISVAILFNNVGINVFVDMDTRNNVTNMMRRIVSELLKSNYEYISDSFGPNCRLVGVIECRMSDIIRVCNRL